MWKNTVELGRPYMTWHMRFACWIPKTTHKHSEYVLLIDFPVQQPLHEHVSSLNYTYTACPVNDSARLSSLSPANGWKENVSDRPSNFPDSAW